MINKLVHYRRRFYEIVETDGMRSACKATAQKILDGLLYPVRKLLLKHVNDALSAEQKTSRLLMRLQRDSADSVRNLAALYAINQADAGVSSTLKVTVIMPVYNRAAMACKAIQSVMEQEGANFELIVIDDGSVDDLAASISRQLPELSTDPRLKIMRKDHGGAASARNHGMNLASGDIIAYLDSDNHMYPGYLSRLASFYQTHPEVNVAYAAMLWDDKETHVHLCHDDFEWDELLARNINLDMNCFSYRRRVYEQLGGFDETLTRHDDYDLAMRYTRVHVPAKIPAISVNYYSGKAMKRVTFSEASTPNVKRIHSKFLQQEEQKLKVLLFAYDYPQLSEAYVDTEIQWLLRRGVCVEVYTLAKPGAEGTPSVPVHSGDLERVFQQFRPDVVHAHWLNMGCTVAETADRYNVPVTVRGHGFEFSPELYQQLEQMEAVRSIYLFPHLFEAVSTLKPVKARSVPACFNSSRFYPRLKRDKKLVIRAGACLPTKNIEAFIHVAARCPQFNFVLILATVANQPDLPDRFVALNEKMGCPVDIRFNVQYPEMMELMAKAGIYLHTFGFEQAFGMPVSIAESLACGAVTLIPDCREARAYAGPCSLYYKTEDQAVRHLEAIGQWDDDAWCEHSQGNSNHAYSHYMDDEVMAILLRDWKSLAAKEGGIEQVRERGRLIQTPLSDTAS